MSDIIAYKTNDHQLIDLQTARAYNISGTPVYFDNSEDSLEVLCHSCAHLMAQAIKELWPEAKFFVGPVVDEGFYYDLRSNRRLSDDDLPMIEKKMEEIASRKLEIVRYEIPKSEAMAKFADDDLKLEVLARIPSETVSIYKQGEFEDLCRGPHLPNTKFIRYFKLTRVAGAYLGGDENREMLTRIYGIAFADKESLKKHITMIEEAKKRDHRKLGRELELFIFDEEIGSGLPIWLPNGARLRGKLERLLYKAHLQRGYEPVRGPEVLRSDMWKVSGHYQNYGHNMYFTQIEEQEYGMKPMNCLGHVRIFNAQVRSYRDLPLKFFEFGTVHRHEKSGVLHGLLRVREFTQDDAHIFCTENQIGNVIHEVLDFVDAIMKRFGFEYTMELATKPEKAIGSDEFWELATNAIRGALETKGLPYGIDEGGGAFYGPKIDIKITDAIGRKWQCGTVQVDLNLPERFGLHYTDENNQARRPVMIHRAILGSFERFIAILTEHFGGEFPLFIAPTQVAIIPVNEAHQAYAKEIMLKLRAQEIDAKIFDRNETLAKRIRTAEKERIPVIVVIGDAEVEAKTVAVRDRRSRTQESLSLDDFISKISGEAHEELA